MTSLNDKNIKYYLLYGCDASILTYDFNNLISDDDRCMRSDTIILLITNTKTNKVKVISLLRDIVVNVKDRGKCKLNSLIVYYGPRKTTKIIGNLLGINISKYIVMNMENLVKIVDEIGGIDLNLTDDEVEFINRRLFEAEFLANYHGDFKLIEKSGMNHLNGIQTLTHVRDRDYGYAWGRTKRQRDVLITMVKQIKDVIEPNKLIDFGLSMIKYVKTNLNIFDIISCVKILKGINFDNIETYSIPSNNTNSIRNDGMFRFEIDFNDINKFLTKIVNDEDVKDFVI